MQSEWGNVAGLAHLNDEDFWSVVDTELRREHPKTPVHEKARLYRIYEELQEREVVLRWMTVLDSMKRSAERQLGARKADLQRARLESEYDDDEYEYIRRRVEYLRWKGATLRFLSGIDKRLALCRTLRARYFPHASPTRIIEERNNLSRQLIRLKTALRTHQETVERDYAPTDADERLWSAVDDLP